MSVLESNPGLRSGTLPLLIANALPVAGLIGFGWQTFQALFVSWVEIGVTLLGYFVVVLFGQRESDPERNGGGFHPGPVRLPLPDGSFQPIRSLPPLRYRNVRWVPAAVPLVAIVWFLLSRAFLGFPNTGVVVSRAFSGEYLVASYTTTGLTMAAITSAIQLFALGRDFLFRRLVDHYSAAMLLELPVRTAVVWFVTLVSLFPISVVAAPLDTGQTVTGWGFFIILLGVKLAIDLALLRLRYQPDPGPFTRLFVPKTHEPADRSRVENGTDDTTD